MSAARRVLVVAALVVGAVVVGVAASDDAAVDDKDVLVLTKDNFKDIVNSHELMLVEFYAPWCGHCKHLAPEYAKAATTLKENNPPIPLAKVDATAESALAGEYKVSGYPKLFVFRSGKESDYNGPREHKGIVDYMKKQVGPAAKPLNSQADIDAFTAVSSSGGEGTKDFCVVGFFDSKTSQLYSAFQLVAGRMRDDVFFGIVSDASLAKANGVEGEAVVAFKAFDDKKTTYSGPSKTKEVQDWVTSQAIPIVGEFSKDTAPKYQKRGLPIAKFYMRIDRASTADKPSQHMKYHLSRLEKAALEFRDKLLVTIVDTKGAGKEMEDLGAKGAETALVVEQGRAKYKFDAKFTADNVRAFFADYVAGKVEQYMKSEPIPASNDGPVTTVVGKTFNQIVNDPEKDVLIEFYAPWCGHCKQLAPKYDKLGEKFDDVDTVVIAKIDATANDYPPEYTVNGFPTLFFKPAGAKKPIQYEGEREVADFTKFIKKHAKTEFAKKKKKGGKEDL